MPNKIKDDKAKVVYNEYKDTLEELMLIADRRRCTLSDVMRLATLEYVERNADTVKMQRAKKASQE